MNGIIHESFAVTQKYAWCSKIFLRFSSTSLTTQCRKHEQNKLFPTLFVFILIIIIFRYLIIIFNFFKSQWEDIVAQHLKVEFIEKKSVKYFLMLSGCFRKVYFMNVRLCLSRRFLKPRYFELTACNAINNHVCYES